MLRSRIRVASLTVVVLLALFAVYPSVSFMQTVAQEPGKAHAEDPKLKELQKERIATARELLKQQTARFKSGQGLVEEVLEATRTLTEAELDACGSDKERIAALEKLLKVAKDGEKFASDLAKSGQGRESTALKAKAERLRVEIELERAKAKKDVPQKGAANSDPEAKVKKGDQQKATTQRTTIQAYESVRLFTRASGFLKKQTTDIGDRVQRGQVLAVVDVPELEAQVRHDSAAVERERSRLEQAKNRIRGAVADFETAKLAVKQVEASAQSAVVLTQYREKQWKRIKDLYDAKAVEERLVDEVKERYDAALETERSTKAAIAVAKAHVVAGELKIEQAKADIVAAEADVKVAQAKAEKSQILFSFATISAPFDGVVTQRGYVPGDFILSAENGKRTEPLMTIQRTDLLRVIVSIPERDVPFVERGAVADVEIDAYPGKKWSAKVSRIAATQDPKTHSISVEIDLPNPTGQIYPGMSGRVTIVFARVKE